MNRIKMEIDAISENEGLARVCVAAFAARLDPTLEEINDVKTAVSEAVTNAVIHGYDMQDGIITLEGALEDNKLTVTVSDNGIGIPDIKKAREPLYTGKPEAERSGMGFTIMEEFMDELYVKSELGKGTSVTMVKTIEVDNER